MSHGLVTGSLFEDKVFCQPYSFPPCNHHSKGKHKDCSEYNFNTPKCKRNCTNKTYEISYEEDKVFGSKAYSVRGEQRMMRELVERGPFEVSFSVYEDFLTYKSGIY